MFNVRLLKQQLSVNLRIKMREGSEATSAVWSPRLRHAKSQALRGCCLKTVVSPEVLVFQVLHKLSRECDLVLTELTSTRTGCLLVI